MPDITGTQLPAPDNWSDFEQICADLFEAMWGLQTVRYGRQGQRQDGIDIYGPAERRAGVQCKGKRRWPPKALTVGQIDDIVEEAKKFSPPLKELWIVTNADDDKALTDRAVAITDRHQAEALFSVVVLGWGELSRRIKSHRSLIEKHYGFLLNPAIKEAVEKVPEQTARLVLDALPEALLAAAQTTSAVLPERESNNVSAALERDLATRYRQVVERASFMDRERPDEFASLAEEVLAPRHAGVSQDLRRAILLRASRSASIRQRLEDAERFLSEARKLEGPEPETGAVARLQAAKGDSEAAIRTLRDGEDPDQRSVLLGIISQAKGDDAALAWLGASKLAVTELTGAGAFTLFQIHFRERDWDGLADLLERVSAAQIADFPYLRLLRGLIRFAAAIPKNERGKLLSGLQLDARFAEIAVSEPEARTLLGAALDDLARLLPIVSELGLGKEVRTVERYAAWCRLLHPDFAAGAASALANEMKDPKKALANVQFAFAFLSDFKPEDLANYLRHREELGGLDDEELRAAFSIRLHSSDFAETVAFLAKHRQRLLAEYSQADVYSIDVQARLHAGDTTSAKMLFEEQSGRFDPDARASLETAIAIAEGSDPVAANQKLYEETKAIDALRVLVGALIEKKDFGALGLYAEKLYRETGHPEDLRTAIRAYANAGKRADVMRLVELGPEAIRHDREIGTHYARLLFRAGEVRKARELAIELRAVAPEALDIELAAAVEMGDWEDIGRITGEYLKAKTGHSAQALAVAARATQAASQGSPMALAEKAVESAPEDPNVLLSAYLLANGEDGEDQNPRTLHWFNRAVELSGNTGPIQKVELKQVLAQGTAWAEQTKTIGRAVLDGKVPLFIAAPRLRGNVVELILRNFLANSAETDPRKIAPIPLFSGRRLPQQIPAAKRLAFDISTLLTLGWLGLLRKALTLSPEILLPSGLLTELFEARGQLRQFQRSRIARAREIQEAIARQTLNVVRSSGEKDALNIDLDDEMADLVRAAKSEGGSIVRPAPIHRPGSFDESIDPAPYLDRLTDLPSVLRKLSEQGALDQQAEADAERFFALQDEGWPGKHLPQVEMPLYLDSLAVAHLQTVRLLELLVQAFAKVFIHERVSEEATAILAYERRAAESIHIVDEIRRALRDAGDKVTFGSEFERPGTEDIDASSLFLLTDLQGVDGVIVDDRFMNQEAFAADVNDHRVPVFTSLDVIDELHGRGDINEAERRLARHRLRRAGVMLVPIDPDELVNAVRRNQEAASAEFRAIRNSISLARLADVPQFPAEIPWFNSLSRAIKRALMVTWSEIDLKDVEQQADAVLNLWPIPEDWIGAWHKEADPRWIDAVGAGMIQNLAVPAELYDGERVKTYNEWVERRLLQPLRAASPTRYRLVVEHLRSIIRSLKDEVDDGSDPGG